MNSYNFNFKPEKNEVKKTSDYLDNLVRNYRVGAPEASEALLAAFMPLIAKYFRLLTRGIWDIDDPDTTGFLRMLGNTDLEQTSERLVRALTCYESDDIRQELVVCLFKTAQKYTNIASNFKYETKTRIVALIRDPLVYQALSMRSEDEYKATVTDEMEIDQSWINGLTAGYGWDTLSSVERAVIKLVYWDGLGEAVAAKKLHMSIRQLRRYKHDSRYKLARFFKIGE